MIPTWANVQQILLPLVKRTIILILIIGALFITNTFFVQVAIVDGSSMMPTLENGQIVLVKVGTDSLNRGDIIVFNADDAANMKEFWIKRVIGIGGDTIDIDYKANTVIVNGVLLTEPYISGESNDSLCNTENMGVETYVVPDGCFFVMGDNRNYSKDSRSQEVGSIPQNLVIGKVMTR